MSAVLDRIRNEPALLSGFVAAVVAVAVSFGLDLTPEQSSGIVALVIAGAAIFTRSKVSPVGTLDSASLDPSV